MGLEILFNYEHNHLCQKKFRIELIRSFDKNYPFDPDCLDNLDEKSDLSME
jgi:hypothetical protein